MILKLKKYRFHQNISPILISDIDSHKIVVVELLKA